ncbi:hypothetical protein [Corallococcus sp. AB011P]|uniref:SMODS domain-containing nucleotidyltransferase n=1 Tax=Corallococcus sp. AB011P TaxID=2316735 RepID=UPI0011C4249F|nr:hypothetical protein [Corallococcus sp. AB011P]
MGTIHDAFNEFLRRIELNPTRVALASQRYNAVKDTVEANLKNATVRQIGSFQRKTKIRPRDLSDALDVDALVVMGEARQYARSGQGLSPSGAIQKVIGALKRNETYRVMQPQANAPVVVLEYADGFKMEAAVGFVELTGKYPRHGGPSCYVVGERGSWRPADYDYDAKLISSLNQHESVQGFLVPCIKMLKHLIRSREVPLKSFHIEILAAHILPDAFAAWEQRGLPWGYPQAVAHFLSVVGERLRGPIALPGSYSPPTDSAQPPSELIEIGKFLQEQGSEAWRIFEVSDVSKAIARWQRFFGAPFPAASAIL